MGIRVGYWERMTKRMTRPRVKRIEKEVMAKYLRDMSAEPSV